MRFPFHDHVGGTYGVVVASGVVAVVTAARFAQRHPELGRRWRCGVGDQ